MSEFELVYGDQVAAIVGESHRVTAEVLNEISLYTFIMWPGNPLGCVVDHCEANNYQFIAPVSNDEGWSLLFRLNPQPQKSEQE